MLDTNIVLSSEFDVLIVAYNHCSWDEVDAVSVTSG